MDLRNGLDAFVLISVIVFDLFFVFVLIVSFIEILKERKKKDEARIKELAKQMMEEQKSEQEQKK